MEWKLVRSLVLTKVLILVTVTSVLGQTASTTTPPAPTSTTTEEEKHEARDGSDKEFYESYYKNMPENLPMSKAKLEYNLIKTIKREIIGFDFSKDTMELTKKIDANNIKYERVSRDSKWVRGILTSMPYINNKEYMYVVRHDKYLCFMTFEANPEKYIQQARQAKLTFPPKDTFDVVVPKP